MRARRGTRCNWYGGGGEASEACSAKAAASPSPICSVSDHPPTARSLRLCTAHVRVAREGVPQRCSSMRARKGTRCEWYGGGGEASEVCSAKAATSPSPVCSVSDHLPIASSRQFRKAQVLLARVAVKGVSALHSPSLSIGSRPQHARVPSSLTALSALAISTHGRLKPWEAV